MPLNKLHQRRISWENFDGLKITWEKPWVVKNPESQNN